MAITFIGGVTVTGGMTLNPAAANDPYFMYVPLLLNSTSTNAQTNNTFLDSSTNNFTITRNGTPTQGSVTPYWPDGQWSSYFSGSSQYLTAPSPSGSLGTGDFTVQCWIYCTGNPFTYSTILSNYSVSGATAFAIFSSFNNSKITLYVGNSTAVVGSTNIVLNTWTHVAAVRSGGVVTLYINGVSQGTVSYSGSASGDGIARLGCAGDNPTGTNFQGYISNASWVIGTAIYTGNFTPPTTPLSVSTVNQTLLACYSNRFIDSNTATTAKTITVNGTPRVQAFQPFSPTASYTAETYGGSGYFGGSGNYLVTTGATAFGIGTSAFTLEGWCYFNDVNTSGAGFGTCAITTDSASDRGVSLFLTGSGAWRFRIGRSVVGQFEDFLGTTTLVTGQWYNFKIVRTSTSTNDTRIYLNGVQEAIGTSTISLNMQKFSIGTYAPSDATSALLNGYVTSVRFNNTAISSSVPTSPLTAISGTLYLANFTNAGIYDAAVQNNAITAGSAQASTTVAKWSPTSMKFNGTTDYLTVASSPAINLNADFTIETWAYATTTTNVVDQVFNYGSFIFMLYHNGTTWTVEVGNGSSNYFTLSGTASLNSWHYFAITRSANTYTFWIDGVSAATATNSNAPATSGATLSIGRSQGTGTQWFTGYIQDFRITKGYARTITTPTEAFPTQ
jgi:hypothetical protein